MKSIATTEILPWLQLAAVVIGGNKGAGALHTRIRPFSVSSASVKSLMPWHPVLGYDQQTQRDQDAEQTSAATAF
jgi:hypothetical protein